MKQLFVSFIIPAFNEEIFLPRVLESIKKYTPTALSSEVIVADNGSGDKTVELAEKAGAQVVIDKNATVGGLRNLAVSLSSGDILVFLDADILLTEGWCENFLSTYESLIDKPFQVTGSRCAIPRKASWIENLWFKPLLKQTAKYINSGHLVTSRELFSHIGGFNSVLETGEDYAFGMSAALVGAEIINNPLLEVVHEGYPKTLQQFIKREIWHGKGDCESLKGLFSSNVALSALVFLLLHLTMLVSVASANYLAATALFLMIVTMCMAAAVVKHKARKVVKVLRIGFIYYFYFASRMLSCLPFLNKRSSR